MYLHVEVNVKKRAFVVFSKTENISGNLAWDQASIPDLETLSACSTGSLAGKNIDSLC